MLSGTIIPTTNPIDEANTAINMLEKAKPKYNLHDVDVWIKGYFFLISGVTFLCATLWTYFFGKTLSREYIQANNIRHTKSLMLSRFNNDAVSQHYTCKQLEDQAFSCSAVYSDKQCQKIQKTFCSLPSEEELLKITKTEISSTQTGILWTAFATKPLLPPSGLRLSSSGFRRTA